MAVKSDLWVTTWLDSVYERLLECEQDEAHKIAIDAADTFTGMTAKAKVTTLTYLLGKVIRDNKKAM